MEVVDLARVRVQPLREGSVLDRFIESSMLSGDSTLAIKMSSLRQR